MASYKHKRSATVGKVPTAGDFEDGEVIVNTADGRLFVLTPEGVRAFYNLTDSDGRYIKKAGDTVAGALGLAIGTENTTQALFGFGWSGKQKLFGVSLAASGDLEFHAYNQTTGAHIGMLLRIGHDGNITLVNNPTSAKHAATKEYIDGAAVLKKGIGQLLEGGYLHKPHNYGNLGSGTIVLDPANGLTGKITRTSGSGEIAAPSGTPTGFFNMVVSIVGTSSTGTPSLTGFDLVDGDDLPGNNQTATIYVECCPDYKMALVKGVKGY